MTIEYEDGDVPSYLLAQAMAKAANARQPKSIAQESFDRLTADIRDCYDRLKEANCSVLVFTEDTYDREYSITGYVGTTEQAAATIYENHSPGTGSRVLIALDLDKTVDEHPILKRNGSLTELHRNPHIDPKIKEAMANFDTRAYEAMTVENKFAATSRFVFA